MAKAMLIMDMPKYCNDCVMVIDSFGYCQAKQEDIPNYKFGSDCNKKPTWCPLREVPQKKDAKYHPGRNPYVTQGYNACIDELLGGGE